MQNIFKRCLHLGPKPHDLTLTICPYSIPHTQNPAVVVRCHSADDHIGFDAMNGAAVSVGWIAKKGCSDLRGWEWSDWPACLTLCLFGAECPRNPTIFVTPEFVSLR